MKQILSFFVVLFVCISCTKAVIGDTFNEDSLITLKWYPSYPDDSLEKNKIALEWCLSYLGATIAEQISPTGLTINSNNTITLDIELVGFEENAVTQLKRLHKIFKESEEYKAHKAFDLGKYIAMTIGSSYHYYKIVDAPTQVDYYTTNYFFNELKGYINNSTISLPSSHRVLSYSPINSLQEQIFITTEVDPNTQEIKEFETLERMANGQLKFAVFDSNGLLIPNAKDDVSRAGKPAKCMWCHEVVIQTLFSQQNDFNNFLSYVQLKDTLNFYSFQLRNYQNDLWLNPNLQNKQLHTNMELSYISYMEPSAQRLALEWNITIQQVQSLLSNISTHIHDEFPFLGTLYHREDIESFAPFKTIRPPSSIREESLYEPNLLQ